MNHLTSRFLTSLTLSAYTASYQNTLLRLTPFAALLNTRASVFLEVAEELDWSPRTRLTYWGAILTLLQLCGISPTGEDTSLTRILQKEAATAPTWDLEDPQQFLDQRSITLVEKAVRGFPPCHPFKAAVLALMLGQRVGDVLRLRSENVRVLGSTMLVITFVETKTSTHCGQFTLAVPLHSISAVILLEARAMTRSFLFLEIPSHGTTHALAQLITAAEATIHSTLRHVTGGPIDLRALRRTGLSRLAAAGAPLETVLAVSRHRSLAMLERYLASGLFHGRQHSEMLSAFETAWNFNLPTIS